MALAVALACADVASAQEEQEDLQAELGELRRAVAALEERIGGDDGSQFTAGIDKRPYIKSADGKFKIELGGRLQARYTYQGRDVNRGDRDGSDRSWAELERARIRVQGTLFDPRFFFRLEWDGHSDSGSLGLTDAFLQYIHQTGDDDYELKIGAGQWKPFFGRQEKQSSAQQLLVDRSLANEFFNIDRNIGLWIEGRKGKVGWETGVTTGIDSVNRDIDDGEFDQVPAFFAHVDVDVIGDMRSYALSGGDYKISEEPGLTTGFSVVTDQNNGSGGSDEGFVEFKLYQFAYDFVFKYQGFSLNGEYFGRWLDFEASEVDGEGDNDGSAIYSHGAYLEAGCMLTEKLQAVGRGSAVWNREGPATGNAVEAGGGFNYFFKDHNLKLSLDVLYLDIPPDMITMTEKLPGLDNPDLPDTFEHGSFSSSSANLGEFQGIMVRTQLQLYF